MRDRFGIRQGVEPPHAVVEMVRHELRESIEPGIEILVVVDVAGMTDEPSSILTSECLRGIPANDAVQPVRFAVRVGEHALLQSKQQSARSDREEHERGGRAIQAHAAGLHYDQLTILRHQADGDERGHEHHHRDDVVHVQRRLVIEEPQQHGGRRGSTKQFVGQIHEG